MTEYEFVTKNLALSADFNSYLLGHPDMLNDLPDDLCIVFQLKGNKYFSERNAELAENSKSPCFYAFRSGRSWEIASSPLYA